MVREEVRPHAQATTVHPQTALVDGARDGSTGVGRYRGSSAGGGLPIGDVPGVEGLGNASVRPGGKYVAAQLPTRKRPDHTSPVNCGKKRIVLAQVIAKAKPQVAVVIGWLPVVEQVHLVRDELQCLVPGPCVSEHVNGATIGRTRQSGRYLP